MERRSRSDSSRPLYRTSGCCGVQTKYHLSVASFVFRRVFAAFSVLLLASGCRSTAVPAPASVSSSNGNERSFSIRGKVVSVSGATVELDHEAVPGFMSAMTMPYQLEDPSVASELHPGDRLTATIHARKDADGFHDPRLDQVVVIAQARPDYLPPVQYHVPTMGETVPDFTLLNQNGRVIHLAQFRGKLLLMTFIYTRCTFADFCPRMSRNFAELEKDLAGDPTLYAATHLLSVSFDPTYDTPAVLRSYGGAYTGRYTRETFAHWDFAAPSEKLLPAMTQYFDVGITTGDNRALTHSLSTVLIGKDGKVVAWYPSNEWKPEDILTKMKQVAAAG